MTEDFSPGDQVWPREDFSFFLLKCPQTVIAVYDHPECGRWLWLDDGDYHFSPFSARGWTRKEPSQEEKERRFTRRQEIAARRDQLAKKWLW